MFCNNCKIELNKIVCKKCDKIFCINCIKNYKINIECDECKNNYNDIQSYNNTFEEESNWKFLKKNYELKYLEFLKNFYKNRGIGCSKWFSEKLI